MREELVDASEAMMRTAAVDEGGSHAATPPQVVWKTTNDHHHRVDESLLSGTEACCDFQIGDHVYQWCSFVGIPAVYQHHGIVMDVYFRYRNQGLADDNNRGCTGAGGVGRGGEWILKIADFSNYDDDQTSSTDQSFTAPPRRKKSSWLGSNAKNAKKSDGCIRTYDVSATAVAEEEKWYQVEYQASWWKRHWQRTGTCTAVSSDAPGLVRARVQFLIEHAHVLPKYNAVTANCECVAVWCKTGTWATLQGISWLALTAAGQAKSAVTVATAAAATQVTVPAAGLWGWLGYTTQASLLSTQPYLLPAIAAYGIITVGAPALWLAHTKQRAKQITIQLNTAFWEQAMDHPDIFVECITEWSALYEPPADVDPIELTVLTEERAVGTINTLDVAQVAVVEANLAEGTAEGFTVEEKTPLLMEGGQSTGQQSLEGPATVERNLSVVHV